MTVFLCDWYFLNFGQNLESIHKWKKINFHNEWDKQRDNSHSRQRQNCHDRFLQDRKIFSLGHQLWIIRQFLDLSKCCLTCAFLGFTQGVVLHLEPDKQAIKIPRSNCLLQLHYHKANNNLELGNGVTENDCRENWSDVDLNSEAGAQDSSQRGSVTWHLNTASQ